MIRPVVGSPAFDFARQWAGAEVARPEVALQVDTDDVVPCRLLHAERHLVAQDPGVVDDDVEGAVALDGLVDEVLRTVPGADVVAVDCRGATVGGDRVDDLLSRRDVAALASEGAADVVDDDRCPLTGQQ